MDPDINYSKEYLSFYLTSIQALNNMMERSKDQTSGYNRLRRISRGWIESARYANNERLIQFQFEIIRLRRGAPQNEGSDVAVWTMKIYD
jgi:hypothetical protein